MSLSLLVGGTRGTFAEDSAREVARVLDQAFGSESDWEGTPPHRFGETLASGWAEFQARAAAELGWENVPNIAAISGDCRGVYLPASVRAVSLPLDAGGSLRCAGLHGLRRELEELAERWGVPRDDDGLRMLLSSYVDPDDGPVADCPEVLTYALIALAANEAVRRDCPLWLVGNGDEDSIT
ncbi:MAG: hypothetical protein SFX72_22975 [Isosphaeraceae bacterium]|nr:hypothetical protein [Isosphaeraceae bacterium]